MHAACGTERAIVGEHEWTDTEVAKIARQQEDVSQSVVFALSRGSDVCYIGETVRDAEACGFGEVVVFLF